MTARPSRLSMKQRGNDDYPQRGARRTSYASIGAQRVVCYRCHETPCVCAYRLTTEVLQPFLADRLRAEHPDWCAAAIQGKRQGTVELWVDFTAAEDYSSAPGLGDRFGVDLSDDVCVTATVVQVEGEWCRFEIQL